MRHKIGTNEPNFLLVCMYTCAAVAAELHYEKAPNCVFCCVPRTREFPLLSDGKFSKKKDASSYFLNVAILLICCIEKETPIKIPLSQIGRSEKVFSFFTPSRPFKGKGRQEGTRTNYPSLSTGDQKKRFVFLFVSETACCGGASSFFLKGIFV